MNTTKPSTVGHITSDQIDHWCRIVHEGEAYVGELTQVQHTLGLFGGEQRRTTVSLRNNRDWRWHKSLPADHPIQWLDTNPADTITEENR